MKNLDAFKAHGDIIWNIANLLRGPYRPPQYRRVMIPLTVLRRLDCVLEASKPKDILISRANTKELLGSAAIVPPDVRSKLLLCDKLFRLRPEPNIDEEFLTCYLRTPAARYQYEREATGASGSMQNIGQSTLKNLAVPVPPLDEQRLIFEFIQIETSKLDVLMSKANAAIVNLTEYRSAFITAATTGKIDVRGWQPLESSL